MAWEPGGEWVGKGSSGCECACLPFSRGKSTGGWQWDTKNFSHKSAVLQASEDKPGALAKESEWEDDSDKELVSARPVGAAGISSRFVPIPVSAAGLCIFSFCSIFANG